MISDVYPKVILAASHLNGCDRLVVRALNVIEAPVLLAADNGSVGVSRGSAIGRRNRRQRGTEGCARPLDPEPVI